MSPTLLGGARHGYNAWDAWRLAGELSKWERCGPAASGPVDAGITDSTRIYKSLLDLK
jgi:hypothetical protein